MAQAVPSTANFTCSIPRTKRIGCQWWAATPPLTAAIPDTGSCYLAYTLTATDSSDLDRAAELKSRLSGDVGTFSWAGRVYEYTIARTPPCLASSSEQSVADRH